jgi:hypothetical protein
MENIMSFDSFTEFERRMREFKRRVFELCDGDPPHMLATGSEVLGMHAIAEELGLPACAPALKMYAEFCRLTTMLGEHLYLCSRFDELVDEEVTTGFEMENQFVYWLDGHDIGLHPMAILFSIVPSVRIPATA